MFCFVRRDIFTDNFFFNNNNKSKMIINAIQVTYISQILLKKKKLLDRRLICYKYSID